MHKITFTYYITSNASASYGNASDHGFYDPNGCWHFSLNESNRAEILREARKGAYDQDFKDAIRNAVLLGINEPSCSSLTSNTVWWSTPDDDIDFRTGNRTYYALHIDGVTLSTRKRIHRLLQGKPVFGK